MNDLPRDIIEAVTKVTVAAMELEPKADELQRMILTLCEAVYAAGQAKGIKYAMRSIGRG